MTYIENSDNIYEPDWLTAEFLAFAAKRLGRPAAPLAAAHADRLWDEYRKKYDRRKAFRVVFRILYTS